MAIEIVSLNIGHPQALMYQNKEVISGISKRRVEHPLYLSFVNLEGDGQADLKHHGGTDKAVCAYPYEHYSFLKQLLGHTPEFGACGENMTLCGLTESEACIGDTFQWGEAVVQISQPRQPCFKLAAKHGLKELPKHMEETGATGYYFRVLQEGHVSSLDGLVKLESYPKRITVDYANRIMHHDKNNAEAMSELLQLDVLSADWRNTFRKRLKTMSQ